MKPNIPKDQIEWRISVNIDETMIKQKMRILNDGFGIIDTGKVQILKQRKKHVERQEEIFLWSNASYAVQEKN